MQESALLTGLALSEIVQADGDSSAPGPVGVLEAVDENTIALAEAMEPEYKAIIDAGLILQLEAADAHLTNNHNDKAQSIIGNAMLQARSTLSDARRAIDDLRQPSLDDLDSALRLEISRFTNAAGTPILFHADQTPPLPDPIKETLIRAVAESLTNIANHARAQHVEVNVRLKDKGILLTIQDDGHGFDASAIPTGHYGILGIKERVSLVNGSFEIYSGNGKGTTLKIQIPL
jgi:NarL family two-component system sensor histidine kinase YdfH